MRTRYRQSRRRARAATAPMISPRREQRAGAVRASRSCGRQASARPRARAERASFCRRPEAQRGQRSCRAQSIAQRREPLSIGSGSKWPLRITPGLNLHSPQCPSCQMLPLHRTLERFVVGHAIERARAIILSPTSVEPPLSAVETADLTAVSRVGKRIVLSLSEDLHIVIHLMIAGRLAGVTPRRRSGVSSRRQRSSLLTATLYLTEAGSKAPRIVARGARQRSGAQHGPRRDRCIRSN